MSSKNERYSSDDSSSENEKPPSKKLKAEISVENTKHEVVINGTQKLNGSNGTNGLSHNNLNSSASTDSESTSKQFYNGLKHKITTSNNQKQNVCFFNSLFFLKDFKSFILLGSFSSCER